MRIYAVSSAVKECAVGVVAVSKRGSSEVTMVVRITCICGVREICYEKHCPDGFNRQPTRIITVIA